MKEKRIIHTSIGDLEVPRKIRQLIEVKKAEDQGSNLMEGYNEDLGYGAGYLGNMFKGYEGKGRQPFTREDVENFIVECCNNPKMAERYSHLLILIIGQLDI